MFLQKGAVMPTGTSVVTRASRPFTGFDRERATYERLKPGLLARAEGKFVAIVGDEWVGPLETDQDVERAGHAKFGPRPLYIRQVLSEGGGRPRSPCTCRRQRMPASPPWRLPLRPWLRPQRPWVATLRRVRPRASRLRAAQARAVRLGSGQVCRAGGRGAQRSSGHVRGRPAGGLAPVRARAALRQAASGGRAGR